MSAEELRQAAEAERREWGGEENTRLYPRSSAIHLALADWLDLVASTPNFDAWLGSALRGATADGARTALRVARLINGGAS